MREDSNILRHRAGAAQVRGAVPRATVGTVTFNKERMADLEDAIADREHAVEDRIHRVADRLPDVDAGHQRADEISQGAQRHRRRARDLRGQSEAEDG